MRIKYLLSKMCGTKSPEPRHRGALFSAAGALHSNDKRRLTQAPASVEKTTGVGASLYSQPFHTSGS